MFYGGEPLTFREMRWLWVPLGIWALASILTSMSGPFGTHEAMTILPRSMYWSAVCAASVGLSMVAVRVNTGQTVWIKLLVWLCFAAILSAGIYAVNITLFSIGSGWGEYLYLLVIVGVSVGVVFSTIQLMRPEIPIPRDDGRMAKFLERLPLEKRAKLIRLEAQDHYLKVVTHAGDSLILMRIGDAAKELEDGFGLQVHRSHWVARGAVSTHKRRAGRDFLTTQDGAEIPVSRNNRAQIEQLMQTMQE